MTKIFVLDGAILIEIFERRFNELRPISNERGATAICGCRVPVSIAQEGKEDKRRECSALTRDLHIAETRANAGCACAIKDFRKKSKTSYLQICTISR